MIDRRTFIKGVIIGTTLSAVPLDQIFSALSPKKKPKWHHVTLVFDIEATGPFDQVYIDGKLVKLRRREIETPYSYSLSFWGDEDLAKLYTV